MTQTVKMNELFSPAALTSQVLSDSISFQISPFCSRPGTPLVTIKTVSRDLVSFGTAKTFPADVFENCKLFVEHEILHRILPG